MSDTKKDPPEPSSAVALAARARVGATARTVRTGNQPERTQMFPGAGLATSVPGLEVKTLSFVGFEPAVSAIDLRDRRNTALRIRKAGRADYLLEILGPRGKPTSSSPLSSDAAREALPVVELAVKQLRGKPGVPAPDALEAWLKDFAEAAGVTLGPGASLGTSGARNVVAEETRGVAFQARSSAQPWASFSKAPPAPSAPRANEPKAHASDSREHLARVASTMALDEVIVSEFDAKRTLIVLSDPAGHELAVQQLKFTPPPQFDLRFARPGEPADRYPVPSPVARELVTLLHDAFGRGNEDVALAKLLNVMCQALLKVV